MRSLADFRPYQRQALDFCRATPRAYLAAKPGAGKTAVALALMADLLLDSFEIRRALVVAPKRVVPQWAKEARRWAFGRDLAFSEYLGTAETRTRALAARTHVVVVSFEFFTELVQACGKTWPFDLVVFDEASRLRQGGRQGSVSWKAMNAISAKTDSRILLMSGSPRPGTAHELFAPVFLLDQGQRLGKTLTGFRAAYLEPHKSNRHTGQVYSWKLRAGMEAQLYGRIKDLYFAVSPDLGLPYVEIDRVLALPAAVEAVCEQLQKDQVVDLDELELMAGSMATVAGKLHQIAGGAVFQDDGTVAELHDEKLDDLAALIDELDGEPLIVCYWYSHELERLKRRFPEAVELAQADGLAQALAGGVQLALLHPASAGHGIDGLQQHFSALAWFALPNSFELYDQANKRIVRSGQRETVRVFRLLTGIDHKITARLAEKEAEQEQFFAYLEKPTA